VPNGIFMNLPHCWEPPFLHMHMALTTLHLHWLPPCSQSCWTWPAKLCNYPARAVTFSFALLCPDHTALAPSLQPEVLDLARKAATAASESDPGTPEGTLMVSEVGGLPLCICAVLRLWCPCRCRLCSFSFCFNLCCCLPSAAAFPV